MGGVEKIPTFLTVGVLVILFVCLKRQARSARLTLWTVGWALVFTHFLAQLLEPDRGPVSSLLLAVDSGSLQAAAVSFLVSVSSAVEGLAKRALLLLAIAGPSVAYMALDSYNVQWRWLHVVCLAACFGTVMWFLLSEKSRPSVQIAAATLVCSLAGAWAIHAAFHGSFDEGEVALLGVCLGLAGLFICHGSRRSSPAALTIAGGFFCWAAVFPIGLLIDRLAPNLMIPGELWNTPKFFVAFGMILAVVEDKSDSIAGMERKARVLNRQLESFSAITSRLLGEGRPEAICPAIASAITDVSNFEGVVIQLEDAERRLQVVGASGVPAASLQKLREQSENGQPDTIKILCSKAQRVGKNSYRLTANEAVLFKARENRAANSGAHPDGHFDAHQELLIPLCSAGGACLGCIRLIAPREASAIDELELSRIEMLAADLAMAAERRSLQTQLVWSEKLAALGQLLAGVAHELSNPLTVIMGYGELMSDTIAAPNMGDYLARLVSEAKRMKRIIDNLLRFSRQSGRDGRAVRLSPVLQEVLALREYYTRTRNVGVELDIAANFPYLAVNEDEIKQILLNLLNNASDALEETSGTKRIIVRAYDNGSRAVIEVEDSGPGFSNLNRALDPFYTTKPAGKGTGLGLSVCYGIVKERGGDLRIGNVEPHGARVTVELPIADAMAQTLVTAAAHA
jgi:two-component system, NtrC family, sensor kinase